MSSLQLDQLVAELLRFLRFDTRGALPAGGISHDRVKWPLNGIFDSGGDLERLGNAVGEGFGYE